MAIVKKPVRTRDAVDPSTTTINEYLNRVRPGAMFDMPEDVGGYSPADNSFKPFGGDAKAGQLARSITARRIKLPEIPTDSKGAAEYICNNFGDCPASADAGAAMAEVAFRVPDLAKLG